MFCNLKQKFYCQPDIPTAITCWSYTLMIFLVSLFLWLEITVFQIWTAISFVIFLLVVILQVLGRKLVLTKDEVMLKNVLALNNKTIQLKDIQQVSHTKYRLQISDQFRTYEVLMLPKNVEKAYKELRKFGFK